MAAAATSTSSDGSSRRSSGPAAPTRRRSRRSWSRRRGGCSTVRERGRRRPRGGRPACWSGRPVSEALHFRSARALRDLVVANELSAVELVEAHLARIEAVNPQVNAIVTLVPERALAEAAELDARAARGEAPGLLHGLPVAVKDLMDTAGIRTTYGSRVHADHVPERDALIVTRLRAAGAVVIGKTNTPEFGAGSHTFNEVFGPTRNPYDLGRSVG